MRLFENELVVALDKPAGVSMATSTREEKSAARAVGRLLEACGEDPAPPQPPVPVTVGMAEHREVPFELLATGTVEPLQTVAVQPQVSGPITRIAFREGQEVGRGQVLFQIDPRPFQATLARAQANLTLERFDAGQGARPEPGKAESAERAAPQPVEGAPLAHYNLGLALRQKGYYDEALKEYRLAIDAGEDWRLNLQAMAEVHLLRRELGALQ